MNGEMLVLHIVCAVLVTGFAVLATGQLARLYGLCGWQANAYMKEFYERHLKSCWILLLMAVEYITISLIEAEGAWQIIIWAVFLVAVCVEGWLYLKKIRWDGERTPLTRRERALIGVAGGLTGLFAALSLFSALAIMSFLLIFIPVIVALSGAILKPFVKKSKTI